MSEFKDKDLKEANVTGGCLGIEMRETDRRCRCGAKIIDEYFKGEYMESHCKNGHKVGGPNFNKNSIF